MIFVKVLNIRIILLFYYYFILIFDSVLFQAHFMFKFCKKKNYRALQHMPTLLQLWDSPGDMFMFIS